MEIKRYAEVAAVHLDNDTYTTLLDVARTGPGKPGGTAYAADNPWHQMIVEPHSYGVLIHTAAAEDLGAGLIDELPSCLRGVLQEAFKLDAQWILFDADLLPMSDLPVYEHPEDLARPGIAA